MAFDGLVDFALFGFSFDLVQKGSLMMAKRGVTTSGVTECTASRRMCPIG
jgi:hypothetical protein